MTTRRNTNTNKEKDVTTTETPKGVLDPAQFIHGGRRRKKDKDDIERSQVTGYVPTAVHRALQQLKLDTGMEVRDIMTAALMAYPPIRELVEQLAETSRDAKVKASAAAALAAFPDTAESTE